LPPFVDKQSWKALFSLQTKNDNNNITLRSKGRLFVASVTVIVPRCSIIPNPNAMKGYPLSIIDSSLSAS